MTIVRSILVLAAGIAVGAGAMVVFLPESREVVPAGEASAPGVVAIATDVAAMRASIERLQTEVERLGARSAGRETADRARGVRQEAVADRESASADADTRLDRLQGMVDELTILAASLSMQGSARAEALSRIAAGNPEPNLDALRLFLTRLRSQSKEQEVSREWLFATAERVLGTFGRPTEWAGDWWVYHFTRDDDESAQVSFQIREGLVDRLDW
jgi:hypothetical protein